MREPSGLVEPNSETWRYLVKDSGFSVLPSIAYDPSKVVLRPADRKNVDKILIVRKWETTESTISELSFGTVRGYVLERPGPDTTTSGLRLRVPVGTYKIQWHDSGLAGVSPYNPVPELFNASVPVDRHILIHNGNYPSNTDGCLLVGTTKSTNAVGSSVSMLNKLKEFVTEKGIDNVRVIISDNYQ
ncbi:hypothetical protein AGMMS50225_28350 [Betaproteobacteria bacterium]|nr:hypothetical protein AGMMS50225_28350 [Betaproteobacteria bacterium]